MSRIEELESYPHVCKLGAKKLLTISIIVVILSSGATLIFSVSVQYFEDWPRIAP